MKIKMLLLDVDGVLTDGSIYYDYEGNEIKKFNVKDGLGLRLLMDSGIKVGIITGRKSKALSARCENLKINKDYIFDGVGLADKKKAFNKILEKTSFKAKEIAYVGDDLPDIPVMEEVGFPIAVADAVKKTKDAAYYICKNKGGKGAVREVCELLLTDLFKGL